MGTGARRRRDRSPGRLPLAKPLVLGQRSSQSCSELASGERTHMTETEEVLWTLNGRINEAENAGDRDFLAVILAPELAFLRADGKTVDDGGRFLQKVAPRERCELTFEQIEILGTRAIVKCVVACGEEH